jgi:hypothetical protein
MRVFCDNQFLILQKVLGQGAAGSVYAHPACPWLVLKIYTNPSVDCEPGRLRWLIANPLSPVARRSKTAHAWPRSLVYDAVTREVIGFTMELIKDSVSLAGIVNPSARSRAIRRLWLTKVAASLLESLHTLHLHVPSDIPLSQNSTSFGIDPLEVYRQAITRLSWLSYSRPKTYFSTRGCHSPARSITGRAAPHAGPR